MKFNKELPLGSYLDQVTSVQGFEIPGLTKFNQKRNLKVVTKN